MKLASSCNGKVNVILGLYVFLPGLRLLPLLYSTSISSVKDANVNHSSLPDFLVNSLGFSNNQSMSISTKLAKWRQMGGTKKVSDFNFVDNAHSVLDFFKQLGFQKSEIKRLVSREPRYLVSSVEESLKPKVKLMKELGISDSDLVQVILKNRDLLRLRLNPVIHALRIVMGSDENVVLLLKRRIYLGYAAANLVPNVELLQNFFGIPSEKIRKFVLQYPWAFLVKTDGFQDILIRVEEKLGIPRNSAMFMYGIKLLVYHDEKRLEGKYAIFKSFGWTQSHVTALIRQNPVCLTSTESRIKDKLDFLMNQLGYKPDDLATNRLLFTYSLEKRLLPRHHILQLLEEKGFHPKSCSLFYAFGLTESDFIERFVLPFQEVHEVYTQLTGSTPKAGSLSVGRAGG